MSSASDFREVDLQSNPFLVALQSPASAIFPLYSQVAKANGMVLVPPAQMLPRRFDAAFAKKHILLPRHIATPSAASRSRSTSNAMSSSPPASSSTPASSTPAGVSLWQNLSGQLVQITDGLLYVADAESHGEARAKISFEELHYNEEFDSFTVLCLDNSMAGPMKSAQARAASSKAAIALSAHSSTAHLTGSSVRPECRSLSAHRDVLTRVLGELTATKAVFASQRLDFFFTDFSLAWMTHVAKDPKRAAEHIQAACSRCMSESIATIKETKKSTSTSSGSSSTHSATAKSLASWPAYLYSELEIAIQCHVLSCLHSKIFSTLVRLPAHKASSDAWTKTLSTLGPVSLFDVGVSPHLVGLCDPRPAVEQMKLMGTMVTPLERLACLQRVEGLLLESMTETTQRKEQGRLVAQTPAGTTTTLAQRQQSDMNPPTSSPRLMPLNPSNPSSRASSGSLTLGASPRRKLSLTTPLKVTAAALLNTTQTSALTFSTAPTSNVASPTPSSGPPSASRSRSSSLQSDQRPVLRPSPTAEAMEQVLEVPPPINGREAALGSTPPSLPPPLQHAASVSAALRTIDPASIVNGAPTSATPLSRPRRSSSTSGPVSVSADDLLPLLVYVILEARPKDVHANITYLRYFSPQPSLLSAGVHSELHYRLANFEAAVLYIESGRLEKQMASTAEDKPDHRRKKGRTRTRIQSISAQSMENLHLLLTPVSTHHRSLFRRGTVDGNMTMPQTADSAAAAYSVPTVSRRLSTDSSPTNGLHKASNHDLHSHDTSTVAEGDESAVVGSYQSIADSPSGPGSSSVENSMFDADVEGVDDSEEEGDGMSGKHLNRDNDGHLPQGFSYTESPDEIASDTEVDFTAAAARSSFRLRTTHSADPLTPATPASSLSTLLRAPSSTQLFGSGSPSSSSSGLSRAPSSGQLFGGGDFHESGGAGQQNGKLPAWLTEEDDTERPKPKKLAVPGTPTDELAARASASPPLSIAGVDSRRLSINAGEPTTQPLVSPLMPLRATLDEEDPLGAVRKKKPSPPEASASPPHAVQNGSAMVEGATSNGL